MRAKTSKGVQSKTIGDHCSFRPLHFLSPFPSTQAHSFEIRPISAHPIGPKFRVNQGPSWGSFPCSSVGPIACPNSAVSFSLPHGPAGQPFSLAMTLVPVVSQLPCTAHMPNSPLIIFPISTTIIQHANDLLKSSPPCCLQLPELPIFPCFLPPITAAHNTPCCPRDSAAYTHVKLPSFGYKKPTKNQERGWQKLKKGREQAVWEEKQKEHCQGRGRKLPERERKEWTKKKGKERVDGFLYLFFSFVCFLP